MFLQFLQIYQFELLFLLVLLSDLLLIFLLLLALLKCNFCILRCNNCTLNHYLEYRFLTEEDKKIYLFRGNLKKDLLNYSSLCRKKLEPRSTNIAPQKISLFLYNTYLEINEFIIFMSTFDLKSNCNICPLLKVNISSLSISKRPAVSIP